MRIYLGGLALLLCPVPCDASSATILEIAVVLAVVTISAATWVSRTPRAAAVATAG
jgi:hypothetical protein